MRVHPATLGDIRDELRLFANERFKLRADRGQLLLHHGHPVELVAFEPGDGGQIGEIQTQRLAQRVFEHPRFATALDAKSPLDAGEVRGGMRARGRIQGTRGDGPLAFPQHFEGYAHLLAKCRG
jgi:hypothetical protein